MRNLILATLLPYLISTHECIHDKITTRIKLTPPNPKTTIVTQHQRLLQSSAFRPIRIYADYTNMSVNSTISSVIQAIFNTHLFPRIQGMISVNGSLSIPAFKSTDCDNLVPVPKSFNSQATNADLILLVTTVTDTDEFLAYASACSLDRVTGRPNIGLIAINMNYFDVSNQQLEIFASTILHETTHVLIMSPELFPFFSSGIIPTRNVTVVSKSGTYQNIKRVTSPSVVNWGITYFGCPSFTGIDLENQGSSGSAGTHWEKVYLGNELMTSQMTGKPVFSQFTLALMQDSGWYMVDMTKAEPLTWGKGQGCSFYDYSCDTKYPEFCKAPLSSNISTSYYCSTDYTSINYCYASTFADACYIKEYMSGLQCNSNQTFIQTSAYETVGQDSRCFQTYSNSRSLPGCYKSSCIGGVLQVTVNGQSLTCSTAGAKVTAGTLTIACPDPADFCAKFNLKCVNDCNGNGKCLNGGCFCNFFFTGSDCSVPLGCTQTQDVCSFLAPGSTSTYTNTTNGTTPSIPLGNNTTLPVPNTTDRNKGVSLLLSVFSGFIVFQLS